MFINLSMLTFVWMIENFYKFFGFLEMSPTFDGVCMVQMANISCTASQTLHAFNIVKDCRKLEHNLQS